MNVSKEIKMRRNERILELHEMGYSVRDIAKTLKEETGYTVSFTTISKMISLEKEIERVQFREDAETKARLEQFEAGLICGIGQDIKEICKALPSRSGKKALEAKKRLEGMISK